MAEIFDTTTSLNDLQVKKEVTSSGYEPTSDFSQFPSKIDSLKEMIVEDISFDTIAPKLKLYYELLLKYLNGAELSEQEILDFKNLITELSSYSLTSKDYATMRDCLLEISLFVDYLGKQLENGTDGIYDNIKKSAQDFQNRINSIISDVQTKYETLDNNGLGGIFPEGSITPVYLGEELAGMFELLGNSYGAYIDRTLDSEIVLPSFLTKKPLVFKVVE